LRIFGTSTCEKYKRENDVFMGFTKTDPYYKELNKGLIMKSVSSIEDVERLVDFNKLIFSEEESVARLLKVLALEHPYTKPDYFMFIESEHDKKIISSLCFIPSIWHFNNIELKTGEMGIVGSLKEYRNKGLIRQLNERFRELLIRDNFDMSHI